MNITNNPDLRLRYSRQIALREVGIEGQQALSSSRVLVIGCGALGSMVAMQLAGAGIGHISIADFDTIDLSNLQRQFFFKTNETGQSKVFITGERLRDLNPEIDVRIINSIIDKKKANDIFGNYDFIIDATDNPDSKKITGSVSKEKGKPCCIGGIRDYMGQVMTFLPQDFRFEDYFGEVSDGRFLPCSLGGVFAPAAALCASIQSSETIKYLIAKGEILSGRIFLFDLYKNKFQVFSM